jgi:RNA polymerase sigma factor (sigma-70 family)
MNAQNPLPQQRHISRRRQQGEVLRQNEAELGSLQAQGHRNEFFNQIIPLLGPLRDYISRRLRIAYLTTEIRTPVYTSDDVLDEVVLRAYDKYAKRPRDVTLEQWLYRIANDVLDRYIRQRRSNDRRRRSLETLTKAELSTLEEIPFTADADAEVWLPEDLDDSEYQPRDFAAPADESNPEQQLARKEELQQALHAFSQLPERDRIVFELFAMEGFSPEDVARITNVPPQEVTRIVNNVRARLQQAIQAQPGKNQKRMRRKAS